MRTRLPSGTHQAKTVNGGDIDVLRRGLREPLLHFLLIGAAIFGLYYLVGDRSGQEADPSDRIVVTPARIARLADAFTRTWRRPPKPSELRGMVEDHIQEEAFYREALKLGLDRDDTIVRRRMRQKMEFLSASDKPLAPADGDLQAFLDQNLEKFALAPELSFRQLYFSKERRGETARADASRVLEELTDGTLADGDAGARGDPSLWPEPILLATPNEIDGNFGDGFASRLWEIRDGRWAGPVESQFGFHLVRINERRAGRNPELAEIRADVEREWKFLRRKELRQNLYRELRDRYDVTIQWPEKGGEGSKMDTRK